MLRGYVVSLAGGAALLAASFGDLFQAVDDAPAVRGAQLPIGCSAWSACPGDWEGSNPTAPLPWIVLIGVTLALACPVLKRSLWPMAFAAVSVVVLAVEALRVESVIVGYHESNTTVALPPTVWFAVVLAALAAIALGPRWQPERDDEPDVAEAPLRQAP